MCSCNAVCCEIFFANELFIEMVIPEYDVLFQHSLLDLSVCSGALLASGQV